jgi:putative sigma-54 modulation protein
MLILVHGNGFSLERELRDDVAEKIETSFTRFSSRIGKVHAFLADLNGPKKGIDKSIRLVIDVEREPVIVIEEKGEDWPALLESITDRACQSLTRQIKRSRSHKDRMRMAGEASTFTTEEDETETNLSDGTATEEIAWNPISHRPELRR